MANSTISMKWLVVLILSLGLIIVSNCNQEEPSSEEDLAEIEGVKDSIHVATGLVYAEGFDIVSSVCLGCHSSKLITQSRATREGWIDMIHWMQDSQGLGDLGEFEKPIIDYLATHYAPEEKGRRQPLNIEEIEWYVLDLEEEN